MNGRKGAKYVGWGRVGRVGAKYLLERGLDDLKSSCKGSENVIWLGFAHYDV